LPTSTGQPVHQQRDDGLALVLVARGDVEENRRKADGYGFQFQIALHERWKLSKQYGIFAVSTLLIDEDGVIVKDVARRCRDPGARPALRAAGTTA
jgi:hypothetical protein